MRLRSMKMYQTFPVPSSQSSHDSPSVHFKARVKCRHLLSVVISMAMLAFLAFDACAAPTAPAAPTPPLSSGINNASRPGTGIPSNPKTQPAVVQLKVQAPAMSSQSTSTTIPLSASRPLAKSPTVIAQDPGKPAPEAAITSPKIRRGKEASLLVFKCSKKSDTVAVAEDTPVGLWEPGEIYSLLVSTQDDKISQIEIYVRRLAGLLRAGAVFVTRTEGESLLVLESDTVRIDYASIHSLASGYDCSGDGWRRVFSRSAKGGLAVEVEQGTQVIRREWRSTSKEGYKSSSAGLQIANGGYILSEKGKVRYTETGGQGVSAGLWLEGEEVRYLSEDTGGVLELYASGLSQIVGGDAGLENLAIIDSLFNAEWDILPAIAWLSMKYRPPEPAAKAGKL